MKRYIHRPVPPGQEAAAVGRVGRELDRLTAWGTDSRGNAIGGVAVTQQPMAPFESFPAKVTGIDEFGNYSWIEQVVTPQGYLEDMPGGRVGDFCWCPARESNGVTVNSFPFYTRMWFRSAHAFVGSCGSGSGSGSGSSGDMPIFEFYAGAGGASLVRVRLVTGICIQDTGSGSGSGPGTGGSGL